MLMPMPMPMPMLRKAEGVGPMVLAEAKSDGGLEIVGLGNFVSLRPVDNSGTAVLMVMRCVLVSVKRTVMAMPVMAMPVMAMAVPFAAAQFAPCRSCDPPAKAH